MKRHLLSDAFFDSLHTSALDVNQAQKLPPECYISDDFFEFDKDALFEHEWLCVGREAWAMKLGDYFTCSHIGEPIVVVRDKDSVLRAFSNVCQHRSMPIAGQNNHIVLEHQVNIVAEIVLTLISVPGHHPRRVTDAGDSHGFSPS